MVIRSILTQFATNEQTVEQDAVHQYLETHTEPLDLPGAIEHWREDLIQHRLDELTNREDPNH